MHDAAAVEVLLSLGGIRVAFHGSAAESTPSQILVISVHTISWASASSISLGETAILTCLRCLGDVASVGGGIEHSHHSPLFGDFRWHARGILFLMNLLVCPLIHVYGLVGGIVSILGGDGTLSYSITPASTSCNDSSSSSSFLGELAEGVCILPRDKGAQLAAGGPPASDETGVMTPSRGSSRPGGLPVVSGWSPALAWPPPCQWC